MITTPPIPVKNGDLCQVTGGTHKGKQGVVSAMNISKTGHTTLTVTPASGVRFKTLAKNVVVLK